MIGDLPPLCEQIHRHLDASPHNNTCNEPDGNGARTKFSVSAYTLRYPSAGPLCTRHQRIIVTDRAR
ncbi:unnamed protein product [Periconia digitata]|uniref:Uncharacterized protein n=1 Tax=Periconia digitata TaxID=1303443 RepID=A0A9W4UJU4_9PLEO|nr:unnamed protein product [Periconia digitata]